MKGFKFFTPAAWALRSMVGRSAADERLACNCQACLAWRRCGSLLGGFHTNQAQVQQAAVILRHAVCELSDLIELRTGSSGLPLAGGRTEPSASPSGQRGERSGSETREKARSLEESKKKKKKKRRTRTKTPEKEEEEGVTSSHRGPSPKSEKESEEGSLAAASKEKRDKKEEKSKRKRTPEVERVATSRSRSPRPKEREEVPKSRRTKAEDPEEEEGPAEPPGRWTLTEARGPASLPASPASPGSARPPEPPFPPPGWPSRTSAQGSKRSKGVTRRERSRDIQLHGFDPERKKWREERRYA